MTKYIDADKLRAEIERRITDNTFGAKLELIDILAWLDSLQQEQQEEPDKSLEEAAEKSAAQYYKDAGYSPFPNVETAAHEAGFIAGAKWLKEQMMDEWLKDRDGCFWDGVEEGKKAMEEQMLKDAVEGNIHLVGFHNSIFIKEPEWAERLDRLNEGAKVKIIIVKEG